MTTGNQKTQSRDETRRKYKTLISSEDLLVPDEARKDDKPGSMFQLLTATGKNLLAPGELLHYEGAGEELAPPHVGLHMERLLLLPVPATGRSAQQTYWAGLISV